MSASRTQHAPADGPLSRHQVIGALRGLLLAAGDGRPVAIVADDVHNADDATVEALVHVMSPRDRIILVLAVRPQPLVDRHLARLVRTGGVVVADLEPLEDSDAAELAVAAAAGPMTGPSRPL